MKKIISRLFIISLFVFLGAGCKQNNLQPNYSNNEDAETTTKVNEVNKVNQKSTSTKPESIQNTNSATSTVLVNTSSPKVVTTTTTTTKNKEEVVKETVLDCGLSDMGTVPDLIYKENGTTIEIKDLDKSKPVVCMGKALLNNCQKAKYSHKSSGGTIHTGEILGEKGDSCILKVTYGKVNDKDEDEKKYANSYLQCEYPEQYFADGCGMIGDSACDYFKIRNSVAHKYINSVSMMFMMALFSPNEIKCQGNMIEKILANQ